MVTMIDWTSILIGAVLGGIITYAVQKYFHKKQRNEHRKDFEGLGKKVDKGAKKVQKKIDSLLEDEENTDICEECGAIISIDDAFCPNCGVEFEENEDEE